MANQGASSSSAPFTESWKYHVFLSFRGKDTRCNFTDHLYSALCGKGINTFRDDNELRRGEEISNELLTAIENSTISVVVFSKNYASSKWCLDELVKILDCKKSNQQSVIPVFYTVDPSDVQNQRGSFGEAMAPLECKYKHDMEKVNKWKAALSQAAALSGFTLGEHQSEAKFIQDIIEEISKHVLNRVCLEVAEHPVGMQPQLQVLNKLLDLGENDVLMVGVWGTGGIGKTTIANAIYNSIAHKFEGCCFLENVRERSTSHEGLAKLQVNLLSEILRVKNLEVPNGHIGATMIQERLSCRKVLLVLDDVNNMEQLYKLAGACDWFGVGSRIIITTRDKQLLTSHDINLIHEVKKLDHDEAMELFSWHAFKRSGPPLGDYAELTKRAIRYAQGLPLALKVLGSCLCGGTIDEWKDTLHGFESIKSTKIQDVLKISFNALDDRVKHVFLDLACFFKDKSRRYAIEILEACDLNPRYGIKVLIEKALISVQRDYIQMHDLLDEMGKDIVDQESPFEPGERSRLWHHEDIQHVLTNDTGTNKITGIMLNSPIKNYEIFLDVDCFPKMKNLKIFINRNVCLSGDISYLPNTLRVLDWYRCPLQSFPPNFRPKKLVVLNMPYNNIKQPESLKHFTTLTSLKLREPVDKWEAALHGFKSKKIQDGLKKATWVEWAFLLTGLCLEILSLAFDQASSPSRPQYALFGMILAIAAVLICIWELIYKCKKERLVLRRWGRLWWFYYPRSRHRLFGTLPDFYGLVGGIFQCICSTVQYVCFSRHADNPIKASLWPAIFLICLGAKRLIENRIRDEHED